MCVEHGRFTWQPHVISADENRVYASSYSTHRACQEQRLVLELQMRLTPYYTACSRTIPTLSRDNSVNHIDLPSGPAIIL
mmetsp:Transcript_140/g.247  ORF Transcript_140/g.247 Transcript_140/m.247 type:complete len:80 (-) Transcript_140:1498-1737(-)